MVWWLTVLQPLASDAGEETYSIALMVGNERHETTWCRKPRNNYLHRSGSRISDIN